MPGGFSNTPKILRGAFVEYGLSIPPLFVVFQFNPLQLARGRTLTYSAPGEQTAANSSNSLRQFHAREFPDQDALLAIQEQQQVTIQEESINFEIRLDATDKLNDGDAVAGEFGVAPQLATLELMAHPKGESVLGGLADDLVGLDESGFSFTKKPSPPMILFIWGMKRVLPVNINSLNITETEFSTTLDPIRATVAVNLTVIEGPNIPYTYTKVVKEASSALNLANVTDMANVVIPG
ncbi:hypothetical protein KFU94_07935 [Chloroflexi bacterium TSY]|nr:hypothetical protein [Chloroflexi bacterium TSY]